MKILTAPARGSTKERRDFVESRSFLRLTLVNVLQDFQAWERDLPLSFC